MARMLPTFRWLGVVAAVLAVAACGDSPALTGPPGERSYGGLMFLRTPVGYAGPSALWRSEWPLDSATPVSPALTGGSEPSTSRDGEWLAWHREGIVWLRRTRSTYARRVTPIGAVDGRPRISPDGRTLVVARRWPDRPDPSYPEITLIDCESLRSVALRKDDGWGRDPTLSPDGDYLVWRSDTRSNGLELLDRQGNLVRVLLAGSFGLRDSHSPEFSPDGRRVAFVATYLDSPDNALTVIDLDGGTLATWRVTGELLQPSWSPDGLWLAACERRGGLPDRVVAWGPESGQVRAVPGQAGMEDCYPTWSE